ncbi:MAG TPA: redoxin domain-containing protein [Chloroflexia bacterium]|jgi:peroxiredoxin
MSSTKPTQHTDPDLGFEVEIKTSGRAYDYDQPARSAEPPTLSPARAAAKAQARRRNITMLIASVAGLVILGLWVFITNPTFNVPSDAVARVNGEYIYNGEVTREIDLARATFELAKSDEEPQSPGQVLETLIDRKLQTQDARKNGVTVTQQEVDAALKGVIERLGVTEPEMQDTLARYNLDLDDLRVPVADAFLINKYIGAFVVSGASDEQDALTRKNEWQTNLAVNSRIEYLKSPGTGPAPTLNSEAPDFTLRNLAGEEVKLSDLRGKPVMINFWATWCAPCRVEIPEIVKMYQETHAEGNYEVLGVATSSSVETVKAFSQEFDMRFPLLPDDGNHITNLYHVLPIPTTFFIDKDGIIRQTHVGPVDRAMMEKWLMGQ